MPENSGIMRGKRGLIMGVANNRSLGWGIAKSCRAHGAELVDQVRRGANRRQPLPHLRGDGPQNCTFLKDDKHPDADTSYDWSFTVWNPQNWNHLYNNPASQFSANVCSQPLSNRAGAGVRMATGSGPSGAGATARSAAAGVPAGKRCRNYIADS